MSFLFQKLLTFLMGGADPDQAVVINLPDSYYTSPDSGQRPCKSRT